MGFVAPGEVWLREHATDWFRAGVERALSLKPEFFRADMARSVARQMITGYWLEEVDYMAEL